MIDPDSAALFARVLAETRSGRLKWEQCADDYFKADVGTNSQPVLIRRISSRRRTKSAQIHTLLNLAGWNARFAITEDSDGWRAVREILEAAFPGGWLPNPRQALAQLEIKLGPNRT